MAETVKDIREWLSGLDDDALVGIDEGGLTIQRVGKRGEQTEYFEIGGMPEEVLLDIVEVMKSIVDLLRGKSGEELAMIHNTYSDDDCKIEYLNNSMWREKK